MTCFRTPNGKTLHSQLSSRQYTRFFYEMNNNGQSFASAYKIALTSKPRKKPGVGSVGYLFAPETIERIKKCKEEHNCSTKNALLCLDSKNKVQLMKG